MSSAIRVAIAGINGRMGRASAKFLLEDPDFILCGAAGRAGASYVGKTIAQLINIDVESPGHRQASSISISPSVAELVQGGGFDVLLDFCTAKASTDNGHLCIQQGIRPVIGSSGISEDDQASLSTASKSAKIGALIIPNFSVGAVLMMEFARLAGAYFANVEIIEMHHTKKLDAPSGTAMHTVKKLAQNPQAYNISEVQDKELIAGARGAEAEGGVRVHSLRLPGLISHQDVIFGAPGELLSIKHDSFNTDCFLKGIALALKAVTNLNCLVVGLDKIMDIGEQNMGSKKKAASACSE